MAFRHGHVPAHKGTRTATTPIREYSKVQEVKSLLRSNRRNLALFTLGCNTAFRASDLLSLRRADLTELADGRYEVLKVEQKTGKVRRITLNAPTSQVLRDHLTTSAGDLVFQGQRGKMSVSYLGRLMKSWCQQAGVDGRVATHTMRKTFVRLQYEHFGTSLAVLMRALNHSSEQQTLTYVGMLPKDIERLYDKLSTMRWSSAVGPMGTRCVVPEVTMAVQRRPTSRSNLNFKGSGTATARWKWGCPAPDSSGQPRYKVRWSGAIS